MNRREIHDAYFEWIYDMMCRDRYAESISYRRLFEFMYDTEFVWSIHRDKNRAADGISLRYRYSVSEYCEYDSRTVEEMLDGPCSVLEMIVALSIRCEETFMDDPFMGDRTTQWFWQMVTNLGLGGMYDDLFDAEYVDFVLNRFMDRDYEPNGKGGLFTIRRCNEDLRDVEIWYQLCWYINTIT